jgi:predicted transcriptional regulator with HTH domain
MGEEVGFEDVFRSLGGSRVRTETLMFLYKTYPMASYPAEIARYQLSERSKSFIETLKRV